MEIDLKWLLGILGTLVGFLANWAFHKISSQGEKQLNDLEAKLEKNTEAHTQLNLALVELKVEVKNLTEKLAPIPKMQSDLAHLHALRRQLDIKADKNGNE